MGDIAITAGVQLAPEETHKAACSKFNPHYTLGEVLFHCKETLTADVSECVREPSNNELKFVASFTPRRRSSSLLEESAVVNSSLASLHSVRRAAALEERDSQDGVELLRSEPGFLGSSLLQTA